jgi:hypothetical protein
MTAPSAAASNGHTKTRPTPERSHGMTRARQSVAFHTSVIAQNASIEAEQLCRDIERIASDAYFEEGGTTNDAAKALSSPEVQDKIKEACDCLELAQDYLHRLVVYSDTPF